MCSLLLTEHRHITILSSSMSYFNYINLYPHPPPYCHCQELKMWLAPSTEHIVIAQNCTQLYDSNPVQGFPTCLMQSAKTVSFPVWLTWIKPKRSFLAIVKFFSVLVLVWLLLKTIWWIFYWRYTESNKNTIYYTI